VKQIIKIAKRLVMTYSRDSKSSPLAPRRSFVADINTVLLMLRIKYINKETPCRIPLTIQIEATSKCNLRCPVCSHSRENDSGKHLTVGELERIVDRLPSSLKQVKLSGIGEPLLSPHFFSLIDFLAERRIMCSFYTNGTLLTPQKCEAIIKRRNIISLAISCDGARKETFENTRLGANFETWTQFVRYFLDKAKEERPDLRIEANTVITRQNFNQLEEIIRFVAELGFYSIFFLETIPVDDIAAANVPSKTDLYSIDFQNLSELGRSLGLGVNGGIHRDIPLLRRVKCGQPWMYIFVRANGNVQPCCAVFGSEKVAVMGNIFDEDFTNIWKGDRFREFRKSMILGKNSLCQVCPYY
jgi:radical SAM protein with 4Fe4S-binding SPASM domain